MAAPAIRPIGPPISAPATAPIVPSIIRVYSSARLWAQAAPGAFLFLGVHSPQWQEFYPVHRADFRLDEDALPIGTAALVTTALRWMEKQS